MSDINEQDTTDEYEKRQEGIAIWKKRSWLDFCKQVMETDKRYYLKPLSEYKSGNNYLVGSIYSSSEQGVFGPQMLVRNGSLTDVFILPTVSGMLGMEITTGSKYYKASYAIFPSKAMIWPVLRTADELERQYTREVAIEAGKHNTKLDWAYKRKAR